MKQFHWLLCVAIAEAIAECDSSFLSANLPSASITQRYTLWGLPFVNFRYMTIVTELRLKITAVSHWVITCFPGFLEAFLNSMKIFQGLMQLFYSHFSNFR